MRALSHLEALCSELIASNALPRGTVTGTDDGSRLVAAILDRSSKSIPRVGTPRADKSPWAFSARSRWGGHFLQSHQVGKLTRSHAMNRSHAKLSPSSAHRWMNCTKSVHLCEDLPETPSLRARERRSRGRVDRDSQRCF
jgi:hypothetical protein